MEKKIIFSMLILSAFTIFATTTSINAMRQTPTEVLKTNLTHLKNSLAGLKNKLEQLSDRLNQLNSRLKPIKPEHLPLNESIELDPALSHWATEKHLTLIHFRSLQQHNSWICGYYAMYNAKFIDNAIREALDQNKNILEYINEKLKSDEYKDGFKLFQKQASEEIYGAENVQLITEKIGDLQQTPFYVPKDSIINGLVTGKAMLIVYTPEQQTAKYSDDKICQELTKNIRDQLLNVSQSFKVGAAIITGIIYSNEYLGLMNEADAGIALYAVDLRDKDKTFLEKLRTHFGTNNNDKALSTSGYFNNYLFKDKQPTNEEIKQIIDILIKIKKESEGPIKQEKTIEEIVSTSKLGFSPDQFATSNTKNLKAKLSSIHKSQQPGFLTIIKPSGEHFVMLTVLNLGKNKGEIIIIMDSLNTLPSDDRYQNHIITPIKELGKLLDVSH